MKLFIAHDDKAVLETVRTVLADDNATNVDCANSHQDASFYLASTRYDLVILQYSLSRSNLSAMVQLAHEVSSNVSIWVIGGSFSEDAVAESLAAGADKVLDITNLFKELRQFKIAV